MAGISWLLPAGSLHGFIGTNSAWSSCSENRQGRSRYIPDRRYSIPRPVQYVQTVKSLRSVQVVYWAPQLGQNWRYSTGFAGALTRDVARDRIKAVLVIRGREREIP